MRGGVSVRVSLLLLFLSCSPSPSRGFHTSRTRYPADGVSAGKIVFVPLDDGERLISPESGPVIVILAHSREEGRETLHFRSAGGAGEAVFRSTEGAKLVLNFVETDPGADRDSDGFPDAAELKSEEDRAAFRAWFVRISEAQFLRRSARWNRGERDCSGLIRFAYREALKRHDGEWYGTTGIPLDKNIPDIRAYHYPKVPVLGEKIFRIAGGDTKSHGDRFSVFADAGTLHRYQTFLVSRNIRDARAGDVLFFQDLRHQSAPHHSMIVLREGTEREPPVLLYHTGEDGVMKRVPADYLDNSLRFRAHPSNPSFLGVYRFHILE